MKFHFLIILTLAFSWSAFGQQMLPEPLDSQPKNIVKPKAIYLGRPPYPPAARFVKARGSVNVKVTIDENGKVLSAEALTGHPLLRQAAIDAALESKFTPAFVNGKPSKYTGAIVFNFSQKTDWETVGSNLATILQGTSAIETKPSLQDTIWEGFEDERKEFSALRADESLDGKTKRAAHLINVIRYKLKSQEPTELWHFNLGIITSGITRNASRNGGEKDFYFYLSELTQLINSAPREIPPKRLATLTEIAKFSEEQNLSKQQRNELVKTLTESRNDFLNDNF